MKFLNWWYIMIIVNDVLIIMGKMKQIVSSWKTFIIIFLRFFNKRTDRKARIHQRSVERLQFVLGSGEHAGLVWYIEIPWLLQDLQYRYFDFAQSSTTGSKISVMRRVNIRRFHVLRLVDFGTLPPQIPNAFHHVRVLILLDQRRRYVRYFRHHVQQIQPALVVFKDLFVFVHQSVYIRDPQLVHFGYNGYLRDDQEVLQVCIYFVKYYRECRKICIILQRRVSKN